MGKALWISVIFTAGCAALLATTFGTVEQTCAVCGTKNEYHVIRTVTFNGYELDMRPSGTGSLLSLTVKQCPACGYCAVDITKLLDNALKTVADPAYKAQLADPDFPELANKFLARMMIEDKAGDRIAAIRSAISAGWASDDANMPSAAAAARKIGIQRILELNAANEQYSQRKGEDELLVADMYRRNGEFAAAEQFAQKGLKLITEEIVNTLLTFELELIAEKDTAVHTVSEAEAKLLSITTREINSPYLFRNPVYEDTIKIPVAALYPDGRTAVQVTLKFTPENDETAPSYFTFSGDFEDGKYHIGIPKGVAGKLVAGITVNNVVFKNCPDKVASLEGSTTLRSEVKMISGNNDNTGYILLNFPATPYCD